ncbi:MAG: MnhB domain-containing protein [archaeon]
MDLIIKTVTRVMFPFIILFGTYIAFHGHLSPGGGFPAGAIIATAFTLLVLTFTEKEVENRFKEFRLIDAKSIASIALLVLIMLEFSVRGKLLSLQDSMTVWYGGDTFFANIFGSMIVATGLIIIVYSLVKEEWKQ